jgi:predicted Zn-dependent peptidase
MEDLSAASLDDVAKFFATYYSPDNAVLSIAGDFDPAEAKRLVTEYFGPIPRGNNMPPLPDMSVPPTFGSKAQAPRLVVPDDVRVPRLFIVSRTPTFGSDGYYVASVAAAILGLKNGSRLYRRLVREEQIASEASAGTFDLAKGSDLLLVDVTALPGVSAERLEAAVTAELDALVARGVTDEEVERAVALIETDYVASLQAADNRADKLSMFATYFDDPSLINTQVERYRTVTAADVSAFAREHLGPDNRATLLYIPSETVSLAA